MNFLPVRPLLKYDYNDGAWMVAQKEDQKKRFKAIICNLKYSNTNKILDNYENNDILKEKINEFNKELIYELSKVIDPTKIAVINVNFKNLNFADEDFYEFSSVYKIDAVGNNLNLNTFLTFLSLVELNLSSNNLQNIKIQSEDFAVLEVFDLSFNSLTENDILAIGMIQNLKILNLAGNNLKSLPLDMSQSFTDDKGKLQSRFKNLEELNLEYNRLYSDSTFSSLGTLPKLKILKMAHNDIVSIPLLKWIKTKFPRKVITEKQNKYYIDFVEKTDSLIRIPKTLAEEDEDEYDETEVYEEEEETEEMVKDNNLDGKEICTENNLIDNQSIVSSFIIPVKNDENENIEEKIKGTGVELITDLVDQSSNEIINVNMIKDEKGEEIYSNTNMEIIENLNNGELLENTVTEQVETATTVTNVTINLIENEIVTGELIVENICKKDALNGINEGNHMTNADENFSKPEDDDNTLKIVPENDENLEKNVEKENKENANDVAFSENGGKEISGENIDELEIINNLDKAPLLDPLNDDLLPKNYFEPLNQNCIEMTEGDQKDVLNITIISHEEIKENILNKPTDEKENIEENSFCSTIITKPNNHDIKGNSDENDVRINSLEIEAFTNISQKQENSHEICETSEKEIKLNYDEMNIDYVGEENYEQLFDDIDDYNDGSNDEDSSHEKEISHSLVVIDCLLKYTTIADIIRQISMESFEKGLPKPFPVLQFLDLSYNKILQDSSIIPIIVWLNLKRLSIYNNPISINKSQKSSFVKSLLENTFNISVEWLQPISESKPRVTLTKSKLRLDDTIHFVPLRNKKPDIFLTQSIVKEESTKINLPKLMPLPNIVEEIKLLCINDKEDDKMILKSEFDKSVVMNNSAKNDTHNVKYVGQNKIRVLRALQHAVEHPVTFFDRNVDLFMKTKALPEKKTELKVRKKERNKRKSDMISSILYQQNCRKYETEIPLNDAINMNVGQGKGGKSNPSKIAGRELINMQKKYNHVRLESLKKESKASS